MYDLISVVDKMVNRWQHAVKICLILGSYGGFVEEVRGVTR